MLGSGGALGLGFLRKYGFLFAAVVSARIMFFGCQRHGLTRKGCRSMDRALLMCRTV